MKVEVEEKTSTVRIARSVIERIHETIGSLPAESGGVLGKDPDGVVRFYDFDASGSQTGATYSPDTVSLKRLMRAWNRKNRARLAGFVHSHPPHFSHPSEGDRVYASRILDANSHLDALLLPIVMTEPDTGTFDIRFYQAVRSKGSVGIEVVKAEIFPDGSVVGLDVPVESDVRNEPAIEPAVSFSPQEELRPDDGTFSRVAEVYDLDRLAFSRVVYVGLGGAREFSIQLARAGVGEHVLIDHDIYQTTNLATQDSYRREIGQAKVRVIAERILDINPNAKVVFVQRKLDDINDRTFERLVSSPLRGSKRTPGRWRRNGSDVPLSIDVKIRPAATLVCGLTDDFFAQARVNRLALHFGLPSLCAQLYARGLGGEITWTYPDPQVAVACHRCILRSRYRAYLEQGFVNNVTSAGTPIFSTTRLNATKGFLALALLHHGSQHPRWGPMLGHIATRQLIQIRMDPTLELGVFDRVFSGADKSRLFFDESVWLPQRPDCPENGATSCLDCGGTGDLRDAFGKFSDTREIVSAA